jgi:hypothetical protein
MRAGETHDQRGGTKVTPEEIVNALNSAGHDGNSDWIFAADTNLYYSRSQAVYALVRFTPLSPTSAEIIAQHYSGGLLTQRNALAKLMREYLEEIDRKGVDVHMRNLHREQMRNLLREFQL